MNNPFDYTPDVACEAAMRNLMARLEALKGSVCPEDVSFCRELEAGKMLGVLIAVDSGGERHTLYAFSGQSGSSGFYHQGFVGPVFDYLCPEGYFKVKEEEISRQSVEIALFEEGFFAEVQREYELVKGKADAEYEACKERCRLSKEARQIRRESGDIDEEERRLMIRQSQFEKAELRRLKKRLASGLEPYEAKLKEARKSLEAMKDKRRSDSEALQNWLFSNFRLLNARGESRSLSEIFADSPMGVPPSGAGECCGPKLLQYAYSRGLHPVAMAEYWYGRSKGGEVRRHGEYYPACRGKCLPVLGWMLQGLCVDPPLNIDRDSFATQSPEIMYENQWFCVVNKPGGMLSVPGKGVAVSLQEWLSEKYGSDSRVRMAHRLDRDTSGLIIATFGQESFKVMQSLFATRRVRKTYKAELEGDYEALGIPGRGCIELPLSADFLDRPRQHVDFEGGKVAVTEYEFTGVSEGRSSVVFRPLTGRTHQLRVHAASEQGLGMPIAGDKLYGKNAGAGSDRLHLHACKLEFIFPIDGQHYCFEAPVSF